MATYFIYKKRAPNQCPTPLIVSCVFRWKANGAVAPCPKTTAEAVDKPTYRVGWGVQPKMPDTAFLRLNVMVVWLWDDIYSWSWCNISLCCLRFSCVYFSKIDVYSSFIFVRLLLRIINITEYRMTHFWKKSKKKASLGTGTKARCRKHNRGLLCLCV